jgi:hypothetical protein
VLIVQEEIYLSLPTDLRRRFMGIDFLFLRKADKLALCADLRSEHQTLVM